MEPVVVSQRYRKQGIGQRLLAFAGKEAEHLGVRFLSVKPVARNEEAISFFYQSGFRLMGQVELFMDLSASSERKWQEGLSLHGFSFQY